MEQKCMKKIYKNKKDQLKELQKQGSFLLYIYKTNKRGGDVARVRSPNRDKAFEIYKESDGNITNREIANILDISEKTISGWKAKDKWNEKLNGVLQKEIRSTPKEKRNKGGQPRNKNAEKFGFFSKYLPEETLDLMKEINEKSQLDILWEQITIQYAAIIRAQQIMYVENKEEMIKELKKHETNEFGEKIEYEFQFAWDRQSTFLNAQSRAMGELRSLIKQYDAMLKDNYELATDEQRLRVQVLKSKLNPKDNDSAKGLEKLSSILYELQGDNNE